MIELAQRTTRIDSSGIRKVFALAADMVDPVNLSIGEPHFDVPQSVKDVVIAAIADGRNSYTLTAGIPELRARLLELYRERRVQAEDVIVTSGVSGGILLSFLALLNEGDEVIIPDPYFVMYKHLANFIGAKPVFVDTYPDFQLDPDRIDAAVTPRTKIIVVNSPNNPTGAVYTESVLRGISEVAERHGLTIMTDEIYDCFLYDSKPISIAEWYPQTIVLSGFSKSMAMTGWRIGYALAPKSIVAALANIQMYSFVCAPSVAQWAALAALDKDTSINKNLYQKKRDLIYSGIRDRYEVICPGGAFYIFPQAPNGDGDTFVAEAIRNNLLIVPGSVFSERKTHFRISYAAEDEMIRRGVEILNTLAERYT
ncbi:MAG: aminotransferase class I/II-fold pyridoxal phosphate-dependent enzyme [bacterium]